MKVNLLRGAGLLVALSFLYGSTAVQAFDGFKPYKVKMNRTDLNKPIRKSEIMSHIREKFPGKILSIREDRSGGGDCHIINSMGDDGELRIIEVSCNR